MEPVSFKFKTKYPQNLAVETVKDAMERELRVSKLMLEEYKEKLKEFESKYDKSSQEFYDEFEAGELGDKQDYFEWFAYVEYYRDWKQRYNILKDAAHD